MQIELTEEYLRSQGLSLDFPERFWSKVDKSGECWIWIACKINGYGTIGRGMGTCRPIWANRASWILNCGPIPPRAMVLHCCPGTHNPACIRPEHLYLGSKSDNAKDAYSQGKMMGFKSVNPSGSLNWNAEIDEFTAAQIKEKLKTMNPTEISRALNCSRNIVYNIKYGGWGHV